MSQATEAPPLEAKRPAARRGGLARFLALPRLLWAVLTWPFRALWRGFRGVRSFLTEDPEDVSLTDTISESLDSRQTFIELLSAFGEHLDALRIHLTRSAIVFAIAVGVTGWQAQNLMALLGLPLTGETLTFAMDLWQSPTLSTVAPYLESGTAAIQQLQTREPAEGLATFMRVALLGAAVFAVPWAILEIYLFIAPGLMARTRLSLLAGIPVAAILFASGVLFAYLAMLPVAIPFLRDSFGFGNAWTPSSYFTLATNVMFWVGVAFEMPLVVYVLATFGLVNPGMLIRGWRFATLGIAILAALITPTTDPVNMALVMLPMGLLYIVSIAGAWVAGRLRQQPGQVGGGETT